LKGVVPQSLQPWLDANPNANANPNQIISANANATAVGDKSTNVNPKRIGMVSLQKGVPARVEVMEAVRDVLAFSYILLSVNCHSIVVYVIYVGLSIMVVLVAGTQVFSLRWEWLISMRLLLRE